MPIFHKLQARLCAIDTVFFQELVEERLYEPLRVFANGLLISTQI